MGILTDLTGKKFNRLLVVKRSGSTKDNKALWECLCECGNYTKVPSGSLTKGYVKSCGCYKREKTIERNTKHGMSLVGSVKPEYRAWQSIKERCLNKQSKSYKDYGGRGIEMYPAWRDDFLAFYNYMGDRPSQKHSVDRYPNNDGHYEPGNVRWGTQKQQASNQRKSVILTHGELTMNLLDWATHFNVDHAAIQFHLKMGRTISDMVEFYSRKAALGKKRVKWNYLLQN